MDIGHLKVLANMGASIENDTPCYVHFLKTIRENILSLQTAFKGRVKVSYSVKANPNEEILKYIWSLVQTLDLSSGGEMKRALRCGYEPIRLTFSGPAKSQEELIFAIEKNCGNIVVESVEEILDIDRIARGLKRIQSVSIRINPNYLVHGFGINMSGKPCQFGIDEDEVPAAIAKALAMKNIRLIGFHIFSGSQCILDSAVVENLSNQLDLFERYSIEFDIRPESLILGAGIGVPYFAGQSKVDLSLVADCFLKKLDRAQAGGRLSQTAFSIETGRYLVANCGYYLTKVVRKKKSRGKDILICDGGMHHALSATSQINSILKRNYRIEKVRSMERTKREVYDIFGPLCTTIDCFGKDIELDAVEVGDMLAIPNMGAYGLSASPINFISHILPKEYYF